MSTFPFFKLPREVRDQIYTFYPNSPDGDSADRHTAAGSTLDHAVDTDPEPLRHEINLLYTCKQAYEEGMESIWSRQTLVFDCKIDSEHYTPGPGCLQFSGSYGLYNFRNSTAYCPNARAVRLWLEEMGPSACAHMRHLHILFRSLDLGLAGDGGTANRGKEEALWVELVKAFEHIGAEADLNTVRISFLKPCYPSGSSPFFIKWVLNNLALRLFLLFDPLRPWWDALQKLSGLNRFTFDLWIGLWEKNSFEELSSIGSLKEEQSLINEPLRIMFNAASRNINELTRLLETPMSVPSLWTTQNALPSAVGTSQWRMTFIDQRQIPWIPTERRR